MIYVQSVLRFGDNIEQQLPRPCHKEQSVLFHTRWGRPLCS